MSRKRGESVGNHVCTDCGCNCGSQPFTWFTDHLIKCGSCGCQQVSPYHTTSIRVYIGGSMNMKAMEEVLFLGKILGAAEDARLVRDNDQGHYLDVPAEGLVSRLEILRIAQPERLKGLDIPE